MKNYKILFLSVLLFLFGNAADSQNVVINGKVNEANALVRLLTYNDMLTCEQTLVYETRSDADGNFIIEKNIDDISLAQIAVNLERIEILIKPESSYKIEINIPEHDVNASYFERQSPTLKMLEEKDDDLYYQYYMSGMIIDDFVMDNFNQLYRGRKLSLLDTLDVQMEKVLGKVKSDYVKENIRYRKAAIQMMINNDNAKKVTEQYFNKQEVLYSQPAYMNLFQEIFTNYLSSRQFNPSDLRYLLYSTYDKFVSYLKEKDVFLAENQNLAEIIIAWNLKRMYYEMPDEKAYILDYLKTMGQNTKNQYNRKIIEDILKQIDRLSFNSEAPDFSLKDVNGNVVRLSDFKENMLLVQFVNAVSHMTDYQFELMKDFSNQWQDTIQIVTIATMESFEDYKQVFKEKDYKWTLLNLENEILLLEKYQVMTFPDYVIIGKNGRIGMSPAPSPEQYLDFHVRRLFNYYKK
ncbi:MAG: redoxin domain-containing protein [Bacteroidales bacterium]|nr:redoxin domain-containing protein [Bacteroidales bacterium]